MYVMRFTYVSADELTEIFLLYVSASSFGAGTHPKVSSVGSLVHREADPTVENTLHTTTGIYSKTGQTTSKTLTRRTLQPPAVAREITVRTTGTVESSILPRYIVSSLIDQGLHSE